jgi:hypothetical protein
VLSHGDTWRRLVAKVERLTQIAQYALKAAVKLKIIIIIIIIIITGE